MAYAIELVGQSVTKGASPRGTLLYQVQGTTDRTLAYSLVAAASPTTHDGLVRESIQVTEEGGDVWNATVNYGVMEQGNAGDVSWSFDISTETFHVTQAEQHIQDYPAGTVDHKGLIGARQDGSGTTYEGVDIKAPIFVWEETHYVTYATVASHSFLQTLEDTTAKCNDAAWRIWAKGEVLFLGASGAKRGEEPVGMTYRFASSKTKVIPATRFNGIGPVTKEGHHYLWVEYHPEEDGVHQAHRPKAVHVERVYDYADFTALGLANDPWN